MANLDKTPMGAPNYRSEKDEGQKCEESAWNTYGPQMAIEGIVLLRRYSWMVVVVVHDIRKK